jgi:hypothetical protein
MMHWVLSGNIFNESAWEAMLATLDRFEIPFSEHKVIPFVGELLPDPPADLNGGNVIVIGPYSMRHIAKSKGWFPGSFDLEPFDFAIQRERWGEHMLNYDSQVVAFRDAVWPEDELRFVRPINDSKNFAGRVYDWNEFSWWQKSVCALGEDYGDSLSGATMIQTCSPKKIFAEYRCWVIKGEIVTISMYKLGERVIYKNWDLVGPDDPVRPYAQARVNEWQPLDSFVIDVCETEDGFKIVEINTINSCGFYACDMQKLIMTLQEEFSR